MAYCFVCKKELTEENVSDEHILLNALGGRLHSKNLICRNCNSTLGYTSDAALVKSLSNFASLLNVYRQRGNNQIVKTEDKDYDLLPGGKPVLKRSLIYSKTDNGKTTIHIEARDKKQARQAVGLIKKRYPNVDIEGLVNTATKKEEYVDRKIEIKINLSGIDIFPSIIKSSLEYYLLCGGDLVFIDGIIRDIVEKHEVTDLCNYYYPETPVITFDNEINISHSIIIEGNPESKLLYSVVNYFGILQCIVILSRDYTGNRISHQYIYDLVKNTIIEPTSCRVLSADEIDKALMPNTEFIVGFKTALSNFLNALSHNMVYDEHDRLIQKAIDNSFSTFPEGTVMSKEMLDSFIKELEKEYYPWLENLMMSIPKKK